ncbi:hypothetical protein SAMN05421848_2535 [Kushneria avicenniae]|uniref:Uncharacterized protein n=1 Tax=Kushneria avicenniae TaxID=402385 RepID=A0A1I1LKC3_9GAMM|nr:hypothetical protein [Kushneria avicenniae]SFC73647.1 hypothetical protein SAMN05421848_2535 [Kushneria avicenniae]
MTMSAEGQSTTVHQFRANRFGLLMSLAGIILLVLNVMMSVSRPYVDMPVSTLTLPLILIAVGIWRHFTLYADMQPDHMKVKLAPALGWHTFLYTEIVEVRRKGNLCRIYYRRHDKPDASPRQVKMKLIEMSSSERERFMYVLKQRLPEGVTVS